MKQRGAGNLGGPWRLEFNDDWMLSPTVIHRDNLYPQSFTATWRRKDDGLEIVIGVHVSQDAGPVAESVTVRGLKNVAPPMRGLPVPRMTKLAAAQLAHGPGTKPGEWIWRTGPHPIRIGPFPSRPAVSRSDEAKRLRKVAELYRWAVRNGEPIGKYIARQLDVSRSYAYNLVAEARGNGLIPPTTAQGRKSRPKDLDTKPRGKGKKA